MDDGPPRILDADTLEVWWWPGGDAAPRARRARVDALLRRTLAPYLGMAPAAIRFGREPRGRPFLADADPDIDFNLSDTVDGTVVAVTRARRVGIDLERLDRRPPFRRLARRWFAREEADALAAMDDEAGRRRFLALWTIKEAACKATGTGIYGRLPAWRFQLEGVEGAPIALALPAEALGARWSFHRLSPTPEHGVALAVRGEPPRSIQLLRGGAPVPRGVPRRQASEQ